MRNIILELPDPALKRPNIIRGGLTAGSGVSIPAGTQPLPRAGSAQRAAAVAADLEIAAFLES